jgi:CheY-like chemotaxis protein
MESLGQRTARLAGGPKSFASLSVSETADAFVALETALRRGRDLDRPDENVPPNSGRAPMAYPPSSRTAAAGRSETAKFMRPKKTILCVDDNEQVLSVRTFLLETRGYRVLSASCPQQALGHLQQLAPGTVDLLLCDLLMAGMDGNELVRRAKQLHPGLPAMIVSGTVHTADRAICADAFLPKGACSAAEMIERIRILVARKRGPRKKISRSANVGAYARAVAS